MEKHFVYIIYSEKHDIFYKGYTTQPFKRLEQHNNGESRFTANKGPWKLVFIQEFDTKKEALQKEKALKRSNRKYLKWIIAREKSLSIDF